MTVINLDGNRAKLSNAFTMNAGTRTRGGCGCEAAALEPLVLALIAAAFRRRVRRTR